MLINDVESYLAIKRAAGFDLKIPEFLLRSFARFACRRNEKHVVARTAIEWASMAPSSGQRDRRLKCIIRFARHIRVEDVRHEIPPDGVFGHPNRQRRVPFIFSPAEVSQLVAKASGLGPAGSLRPHTYSTLFALLAATGLRISEALRLRLNDITPDGLVIRTTSFARAAWSHFTKRLSQGSSAISCAEEARLETTITSLCLCGGVGCTIQASTACFVTS
jgi:integrase